MLEISLIGQTTPKNKIIHCVQNSLRVLHTNVLNTTLTEQLAKVTHFLSDVSVSDW